MPRVADSALAEALGVLRPGQVLAERCRPKPGWMHWLRMPPEKRLALEQRHGAPGRGSCEGRGHARRCPPPITAASTFTVRTRRPPRCGPPAAGCAPALGEALERQPRLPGEDAEDPVGAEPALAPAHARPGVVLDAVERGVSLADGLDVPRPRTRSRTGTPRDRRRGPARPGPPARLRWCSRRRSGRPMPHTRTFSVSSSPSCFKSSFTCSAIAGEAVSPGDWMPATWMKPGAVADGAIRKSSPGSTGRRPAKLVMMSRRAMDGTMRPASSRMRSRFSGVVATSSLSSTSSAVGPDHRGALDRGDDEHALRRARRHGEHHVRRAARGPALEDVLLALARREAEVPGAARARDLVGAEARGVHHPPGLEGVTGPGGEHPVVAPPLAPGHVPARAQVDPVGRGPLHQGEDVAVRLDDAPRGRIQAPDRVTAQLRLEGEKALAADHLEARHTVGDAPGVQLGDRLHLLEGEGGHDDAAPAEREAEVGLQAVEQEVPAHLEARLEAARGVVEARVHDARVGLGDAEGDVDFALEQRDRHAVGAEGPRDRGPGDAGADDGNVDHAGPPSFTRNLSRYR